MNTLNYCISTPQTISSYKVSYLNKTNPTLGVQLETRMGGKCFPLPWTLPLILLLYEQFALSTRLDLWFNLICLHIFSRVYNQNCKITQTCIILSRRNPEMLPYCQDLWRNCNKNPMKFAKVGQRPRRNYSKQPFKNYRIIWKSNPPFKSHSTYKRQVRDIEKAPKIFSFFRL